MPFWEILLLGIDSAFIYKFYYEYKQKNSFADLLEVLQITNLILF